MTTVKELDKKAKELVQSMSNEQYALLMDKKLDEFFRTAYIRRDSVKAKQLNREQRAFMDMGTVEQQHYYNGITYSPGVTRFNPKNNNPLLRAEDCLINLSNSFTLLKEVYSFTNLLNHAASMMECLLGIDFCLTMILSDIKDYETRDNVLNNKIIQRQYENYSKILPRMLGTIERIKKEKPHIYDSVDEGVITLYTNVKESYEEFIIKEPLIQRVEIIENRINKEANIND